jgi:UDP-3-O-[3-hydroxymyristoyl] glucosamine N-acyltransferase
MDPVSGIGSITNDPPLLVNAAMAAPTDSPRGHSNDSNSDMSTSRGNGGNRTLTVEFVACILAPSCLSSDNGSSSVDNERQLTWLAAAAPSDTGILAEHLLPVAGIPILVRLLTALQAAGFVHAVIVLDSKDTSTRTTLSKTKLNGVTVDKDISNVHQNEADSEISSNITRLSWLNMTFCLTLLTLDTPCRSDGEALRCVEESNVVAPDRHLLVVPGDLVVEATGQALRELLQMHRLSFTSWDTTGGIGTAAKLREQRGVSSWNHCYTNIPTAAPAGCSILLAYVGAMDEKGHPLKESAKQKKGLFSRDEEDIDYMAISGDGQLVWKQPKLDVEDDKEMVGSTPKLVLPKARLPQSQLSSFGTTTLRVGTEWNDVQCYCLAPWVRRLLVVRTAPLVQSLRHDLLPLLIQRQSKGIAATLGRTVALETIESLVMDSRVQLVSKSAHASTRADASTGLPQEEARLPQLDYSVLAHVTTDTLVVRATSIAAYLYANREVTYAIAAPSPLPTRAQTLPAVVPQKSATFAVPEGALVHAKMHSIVLADCQVAEKVTFKASVVGRHCQLGTNCRLNNVVLHDDVVVGDQAMLQNTIVGHHAVIGDNCSLNDCQVGANVSIPSGTKAKGEAFMAEEK